MSRSKVLLLPLSVALIAATLAVWVKPSLAATSSIADSRFDVLDSRAEVTAAAIDIEDDLVVVAFTVEEYANPGVDWGWVYGTTGAIWYLDVDLDGVADYSVYLVSLSGRLRATVYAGTSPTSANRTCSDVTTQSDASSRGYGVAFRHACIGYAPLANWQLSFLYDGFVFGLERDVAPDFGWAGPVIWTSTAPPPTTAPPVTTPPTTRPPTTTAPPTTSPPAAPTTDTATLIASRPTRVYDSRGAGGRRAAGSVTEIRVDSVRSVPRNATALMATVTVVDPQAAGYVTVFPCGRTMPEASNLNFVAGQTVPNAVLTSPGSRSSVCVYTSAAAHLVVDVAGHAPAGSSLQPVTPWRALDTRATGRARAGVERRVRVDRPRSVPSDAAAVMVNVTAVNPSAAGYVSVYPCGRSRPEASSVNFAAGQTVPNAVLAKVGSNSSICVWASVDTDLIIDVNGSVARSASLTPTDPVRVFDSRTGGRRGAGTVTEVSIGGLGGVPANTSTLVLNVTVTDPTGPGYATVFPCGQGVPDSSNLNFSTGQTVANAAVTGVGSRNSVCVFTSAATHVIVDVNGYDTRTGTVTS